MRLPFVLLCLLQAAACAGADSAPPAGISHREAVAGFALARSASDADAGALWGRPLYGPMLFVDPGTRAIVANQADAQGLLQAVDSVFTGNLPNEIVIANHDFTWAGVHWTMVMWPLPSSRSLRACLLLHECFHRIQDDLGLPAGSPSNNHLDGRDGRIWLRLEFRALANALDADGPERREAIEDALVFRAYRRSLSARAAGEENALELNEGLAEYTGFRMSGWPDSVLTEHASARLLQEERGGNFTRHFAYASGPAYGILLDEAGAKWRPHLQPGEDLGALLAAADSIRLPARLSEEAAARSSRYDGPAVTATEDQRATEHRARLASFQARFVNGPVLVLPFTEDGSYTFDSNGAAAFGEDGTVYRNTRDSDRWGILEVTGGAWFQRGPGGAMTRIVVPAPARSGKGNPLSGDGWTLTLNPGWKLVPGPRGGDRTVAASR